MDHIATGAVPPSSIKETLAFAPPAVAILFRSLVSAAKAAVRSTGFRLGDGEELGDWDGLGLGVTIATGLGDGVPRLPTRTSGTAPGNTTTTTPSWIVPASLRTAQRAAPLECPTSKPSERATARARS